MDHATHARPRPLLVTCAILVFAVCLTGVAYAGNPGDYTADGVNIRTGPGTAYTSLGLGYIGQGACVYFDTMGECLPGSCLWRYHTNQTTSVTGYSWRPYVAVTDPYGFC